MADVTNCDELKAEVAKTESHEKGKQRALIVRALEIGCVDHIPDDWGIGVSDHGGREEDGNATK